MRDHTDAMGWRKCIEEWEEERSIVRQTNDWGSIEEGTEAFG